MKRITFLFSLLTILLHCVSAVAVAPPGTELVDRVVAVVNDDVITLSEVEEEGRDLFARILRQAPVRELNTALDQARRQVLSSLIDKKLVEQRAKALGVTVDEADIDMAIEQMAATNGLSPAAFLERLAADGVSVEHYRQQLRWQVLQSKLISYEIRSKVVITEEKARRFYQENYTDATVGSGYHLLQIGVTWQDAAGEQGRKNALATARNLRLRALSGENFRDLARQYSDLPSKNRGGDVGHFTREEMAPYMRQAILSLKPGEISELVETPDHTVQFFKLLSVKTGDVVQQAPYEAVRDEIMQRLREKELERQFEKWVKDLRNTAYIRQIL